jgi:tetratricopeptide (TPR) repeat protein
MKPALSLALTGTTLMRVLAQMLVCLACLGFGHRVWAVDHNDVQTLLRQAKDKEALALVETALASKPRDPQMRFWRGLLLDRQGQRDLALQIYRDLTQDYPELPEPHNNLGVILAAKGDLQGARAAFEMALRTNPAYAIAHENLGDIWMQLARQSYQQALRLEHKLGSASRKLEQLEPALKLLQGQP